MSLAVGGAALWMTVSNNQKSAKKDDIAAMQKEVDACRKVKIRFINEIRRLRNENYELIRKLQGLAPDPLGGFDDDVLDDLETQ